MKRLKVDPDTSAMIKMGLIDCACEAILSLICKSEEES